NLHTFSSSIMLANAVLLAADPGLTDTVIISHVLGGRTEEYEILVRRYNNLLYKTAHGILTKEEDIEDVMQEAYIRGFKKLDQFKGEAKFSTWLTRILINCALQQANRLKNTNQVSLESSDDLDLESIQEIPEDSAREEI